MAKRFTDTNKYKKPFIRSLQGAYKLFWDYLYHDCDHAGIWIVDFEIAQIYLGNDMKIDKYNALKYFNSNEKRIIEIDNGSKWFIPSFIDFQYGELNEKNRAHNSVITILNKYELYNKGLIRGLQACKDKDKEMDKDNYKWGELKEKLNNQSQWHISVIRATKLKTASELKTQLDKYLLEQEAKDNMYDNEQNYKSHFVSWVNKKKESEVNEVGYQNLD